MVHSWEGLKSSQEVDQARLDVRLRRDRDSEDIEDAVGHNERIERHLIL